MIAELLLLLAGHDSSLFQDASVQPSFAPFLHPGEQQVLETLAGIAARYRRIRSFCNDAQSSHNRYICALCSKLGTILREEYETLVVETEAKILRRDEEFVARGSFVPVSSIRATFAQWDMPLRSLEQFVDKLEKEPQWLAGPLIDLLLERANTGIHSVSSLFSRLSVAVQQLWAADLSAFLVHGTVTDLLPLAIEDKGKASTTFASMYVLQDGMMPSCVSTRAKESILYVGRAIATVKSARKLSKQFPRTMAIEHAKLLDSAYPEDIHNFERVITEVRTNVSEWLWLNVLTEDDVEDAIESLSNYFLLRNGEFSLALIREFERLKVSRLTLEPSSRQSQMIREQDLHLAMLRASLGTSAQQDPNLTRLSFMLPSGPIRPLLPSLQSTGNTDFSEQSTFDDMLLGTQLKLAYALPWPLDLFLTPAALSSYNSLFAFLSTIRKTHVRVLDCWVSLSNAQRARRRWTGTSEGGTQEDLEIRERLLRFAWGSARTMNWFLEAVMEYVWCDVVEEEYEKLKAHLGNAKSKRKHWQSAPGPVPFDSDAEQHAGNSAGLNHLDFNTLRFLHHVYINHLLNNTLISQPLLSVTLRSIFETCEHFVGQIERWGGDVLPPLLFEGSLTDTGGAVGRMVIGRWEVVKAIHETLTRLLDTFYEQLSLMISQPFQATGDTSMRSFMVNGTSNILPSFSRPKGVKTVDVEHLTNSDTRRHIERLLLRLDFSGGFSKSPSVMGGNTKEILRQGGLG